MARERHTHGSLTVVTAARVDALRALGRLSGHPPAAAAATDAVVSLQEAANHLGVIERALSEADDG